ncbi:unnamed protein product [Protopolystoma xenopodis]|uniref:Uncharacterized protein n=1 Tax=Protopolystoma xenopodis TaxID=117903 RepID=A0A448XNT7_9PLAT|nr:unnamed protein product [Protopolystoma xenopodis]
MPTMNRTDQQRRLDASADKDASRPASRTAGQPASQSPRRLPRTDSNEATRRGADAVTSVCGETDETAQQPRPVSVMRSHLFALSPSTGGVGMCFPLPPTSGPNPPAIPTDSSSPTSPECIPAS